MTNTDGIESSHLEEVHNQLRKCLIEAIGEKALAINEEGISRLSLEDAQSAIESFTEARHAKERLWKYIAKNGGSIQEAIRREANGTAVE